MHGDSQLLYYKTKIECKALFFFLFRMSVNTCYINILSSKKKNKQTQSK